MQKKKKVLTQSRRGQDREHNTRTRSIPFKHFTLHQNLRSSLSQLFPHLFLRLPKRQRLRLSEKIGKKNTVMFRVFNRIVCSSRSNKIGRDEFGTLMNELVEGVLTIRTSCSPDDRLKDDRMRLSKMDEKKTNLSPQFGSRLVHRI